MQIKKRKNQEQQLDGTEEQTKSVKKKRFKVIGAAVVGAVVLLGLSITIPIVTIQTFTHEISYTCTGVDEEWLKTHPFDTSNFPSALQHSSKIKLTAPDILGYTFKEWTITYPGNNLTLQNNDILKIPYAHSVKDKYKNIVIIANYEINTYRISLNINNGHFVGLDEKDSYDGHTYQMSVGVGTTTYTCLDKPFKFPTAEMTGYDFSSSGYRDRLRNQYYEGCDTSLLRDFELEAEWTIHPYAISYSFIGEGVEEFASGIINNNPVSATYEESPILNDAFLKGYSFLGWYRDNQRVTVIPQYTFPSSGTIELVGKFEPIVYNITYSDESNSNHSHLPTSYKRCSPDIAIPAIEPTGYTFKGWISSNVTTFTYVDTIPHGSTGDLVFTADVELITYHISFVVDGVMEQYKNSFSLKDRIVDYTINSDTFSLPSSPTVSGYSFVGYFDQDGHQVVSITKGSIGDKQFFAKFTPTIYQATLVNTRGSTRVIDYTVEDELEFDNPSSTGYTFQGWIDDNGNKISSIAVGDAITKKNFTLTSQWLLDTYDVSYEYEGLHPSTQFTNDNVSSYNYETDIVLSDLDINGYTFKGWYDESGNKITRVNKHTTVGDRTFTARFEPISYTITRKYKLNAIGANQVETMNYYVYTEEFTLPNVSSTVRKFIGWKETTSQVMYYPGSKFGGGMIGNYNLEAVWSYLGEGTESDPYQIFDAGQLMNIEEMDKCYVLKNDITISSNSEEIWEPVGTSRNAFSGKFDGNGKTINLIADATSNDNYYFPNYFGIFGFLGPTACVHNFTVNGSIGSSTDRLNTQLFGVVAAENNGTIENVTSRVPLYLASTSRSQVIVGGIAGNNLSGFIRNCSYGVTKIDVDCGLTSNLLLGGIVGYGSGGAISNCSSSANLIGRAKTNSYVGGLLGDRDLTSATRISWDQDPETNNPVAGSTSSSVLDSGGSIGMTQYSNKNVVGKEVAKGSAMSSSSTGLEINSYYYVLTTSSDGQWMVMCWVKYLGNNQWDYSNSKNQIIYQ